MTDRVIAPTFVQEALLCLRASKGHATAAGLSSPVTEPMTAEEYGRLWRQISQEMDDEFFGLGARPMPKGSFELLCYSTVSTLTLKDALLRALQFLNVMLGQPSGRLIVGTTEAHIAVSDSTMRSAFAYRTYWLILMGVVCWLVGRRIPIRRLDFSCPVPVDRFEYTRFFGVAVGFDAAEGLLGFDAELLSLPVVRQAHEVTSFLQGAPANILLRFRNDQGMTERVRQFLLAREPADWPSFAAIAMTFGKSPATLRRHLGAEGQGYREIIRDLRMSHAARLLAQGDMSVADIAALLGYSEASAFFRAFKKWSGHSPRHDDD